MTAKKSIFFGSIGTILILISLVFLFYSNPQFLNTIKNSQLLQRFKPPRRPIEIVDEVYNYKYNFDPSIHNDPKVVEFIRGTEIDRFDKEVVITSDVTKRGASLSENGNIVTGYGHNIDYQEELVHLYIFIDPQFVTEDKLTTYLNYSYLGALLTAAEKSRLDKDKSYVVNYGHAGELAHELSVVHYDTNSYFLTKK